ncbi:MAG: hypothetical protein ACHQIO_07445 [Nevskiales bacterium]
MRESGHKQELRASEGAGNCCDGPWLGDARLFLPADRQRRFSDGIFAAAISSMKRSGLRVLQV